MSPLHLREKKQEKKVQSSNLTRKYFLKEVKLKGWLNEASSRKQGSFLAQDLNLIRSFDELVEDPLCQSGNYTLALALMKQWGQGSIPGLERTSANHLILPEKKTCYGDICLSFRKKFSFKLDMYV